MDDNVDEEYWRVKREKKRRYYKSGTGSLITIRRPQTCFTCYIGTFWSCLYILYDMRGAR